MILRVEVLRQEVQFCPESVWCETGSEGPKLEVQFCPGSVWCETGSGPKLEEQFCPESVWCETDRQTDSRTDRQTGGWWMEGSIQHQKI